MNPGEHRNLGLHITRVISTKLDCWTAEEVAVAEGVGNKRANMYWEGKKEGKPISIQPNSSQAERRTYIKDKYIKKLWLHPTLPSPYESVLSGEIETKYCNEELASKPIQPQANLKVAQKTPEAADLKQTAAANKVLV